MKKYKGGLFVKKKSNLIHKAVFVSRCLFGLGFFACIGLLYVWQNVQVVQLGYQIKDQEKQFTRMLKTKRVLETELSSLKMPGRIQKRILNQSIPLELSGKWQVVHLQETPFFYLDDHPDSFMNPEVDSIGHTVINIAKLNLDH